MPGCHEQKQRNIVIYVDYAIERWPSKTYSHLHVGEGWKQTDTSFPTVLDTGHRRERQSG